MQYLIANHQQCSLENETLKSLYPLIFGNNIQDKLVYSSVKLFQYIQWYSHINCICYLRNTYVSSYCIVFKDGFGMLCKNFNANGSEAKIAQVKLLEKDTEVISNVLFRY